MDKTEKVVYDGYEVIFEKTDIWNEGYTGKITITNTSDSIIKDWRLTFESEDEIISVWDAELLENAHPSYLVGGPSHNQNIVPGQSASFGMTVSGMDPDSVITNVSLSQFTEPETEEEYDPGRELEPLQSIGEAYYKDVTEADVILNEETGILYVKNQILISGVPGEPKELFENLAAELGAEIVGYLEITNDYQLEFVTDKSAEELDAIIEAVKGHSFVSYASLNIASYVTSYATSNDALYQDNQTTTSKLIAEDVHETGYNTNKPDNWEENLPDGDNWGLEALKVPGAWDYKEYFEPVKVGIIDSYLYTRHKDLVYDDVLNQASSIGGIHGTGVAGVIAAQHNNGTGISGVATDVRLYGFDRCGKEIGESMQEKYALLNLIVNDVRVINMSFGYTQIELKVGATMGNRNAIQYIDADAKIKGEFLNKLLDMGYDYILVCAAGNDTDDYVVRDDNATYGFVPYNKDKHSYSQIFEGEYVDARFGSEYTAISKWDYPDVYDRIITVGAIYHSYFAAGNMVQYNVSEYSNRGARIDVVAPADDIIWTIPPEFEVNGFEYILKGSGGTSTAAPHITGVIALMYQANPSLPGDEAKRIICENYSELITDSAYQKADGSYYSYKLPDAERCVWNALYGEREPYVVSGTLLGRVVGKDGEPISEAKVCAVPTQWGNYTMRNEEVVVNTDVNGEFQMKLEEQYYHLIISAPGYVPYTHANWHFVGSEKITDVGELKLKDTNEYVKPEDCDIHGHIGSSFGSLSNVEATIRLRAGWDNQSGPYLTDDVGKEYFSRAKGDIYFSNVPYGEYTAEIQADGYVTAYVNVVSTLRKMRCVSYNITPIFSEDTYIIEVCYTSDSEIDLVAMYYDNGVIKNKVPYGLDNEEVGRMNRFVEYDNRFYQREIVVMYDTQQYLKSGGEYKYCLYAYDDVGGNSLSMSRATIRLYKGNELIDTYTIPVNKKGNVCRMLTLDEDGWHYHGNFYDEEDVRNLN